MEQTAASPHLDYHFTHDAVDDDDSESSNKAASEAKKDEDPSSLQQQQQQQQRELLLQAWRTSGVVNKILDRPAEQSRLLDAYGRLLQQQHNNHHHFHHHHHSSSSNSSSIHARKSSSGQSTTTTTFGMGAVAAAAASSQKNNVPVNGADSYSIKDDEQRLLVSQAIFVSSSQAGLGQDGLVQSLRQRVLGSSSTSDQHHAFLWLEMDCDRGSHPDPHIPAVRALQAWATRALAGGQTSSSPRTSTFLALFCQYLNQCLTPKEWHFLAHQVPELDDIMSQFGSTATSTVADKTPQEQSNVPTSLRQSMWKTVPSSSSSSTHAAVYSCQKRAILFRPTLAKFVYSLAKAAAAASVATPSSSSSSSSSSSRHNNVPVVVFANLHRGDEVLLDMLRHLLKAQDLREYEYPYLCVTTYQQDPDNYMPACIDLLFDQLKRRQVLKTKIVLEPLEADVLSSRIENILHVDTNDADTIMNALIKQSGCMPWLVEKRLEQCVAEGSLTMDAVMHTWEFQSCIRSKTPYELCGLDDLSPTDLQFLHIVACLGRKTNRTILEKARASECLDDQLASAVEKGFLVQTNESEQEYGFAYEGLRDLVYLDISAEDRPKFHYQIAENLWLSFDLQELDENILLVVENLLLGRSCLPNKKRRAAVAHLCLRTGELRAEVSAYYSAFFFFSTAIELIPDGWDDEYHLCLALHCATCEVANCLGLTDVIFQLAAITIEKARTFHDALRAHISKVYTIGSQGDCVQSVNYAVHLLEQLGEPIVLGPSRRQAVKSLWRTYRRLKPMKTDEQILRLPPMENSEKQSAMRILNSMIPYIFNAKYFLIPVVIDKMIELTLDYGTSALSGIAFAMLGAVQCWAGDTADGQRFGNLALRLTEMYQVEAWMGRVATFYFSSVQTWRRPFRESLPPMRAARQIALLSGDIEFAMVNANLTCVLELDLVPIPELLDTIRDYQETMKKHGQVVNLQMLLPSKTILLSCAGDMNGDVTVLEEANDLFKEEVDASSLVALWLHYARMLVAFLFGNIDQSSRSAELCSSLICHPVGSADTVMPCMVDGLLALEKCRRQWWNMPALVLRARRRIRQLRRFAASSPSNFLGKLHLVQAELASVLGQRDRAHMKYTSSIALFRDAGFNLQLGLANELAGKHFLRLKDDRAKQFLNEADRVYRVWGGIAKADHLLAEVA